MAESVNLPGLGKTRVAYVVGAIAIVTGIVGFAYYRRSHGSSSSSSSATGSTSSPPIDAQTGYPQGSPEDLAALQALSDGAGYSSAYGTAYGDGYGYGYSGIPGIPTTVSNPNSGPGTFTDNAYWIAYAEENIIGYSPMVVQGALTAALSGTPLTSQQFTIWQTALAVAGNPPNPPAVPPAPPASGGGGGGGTPPPVTGPPSSTFSGAVHNLRGSAVGPTSVHLTWDQMTGNQGYEVQVHAAGSPAGSPPIESEQVSTPAATITGLKAHTRYRFNVRAIPGRQSSTLAVTTG